jgi:hypothetical protein
MYWHHTSNPTRHPFVPLFRTPFLTLAADALGEVASLHSTVGEVRSLLVQEARAKLATAAAAAGKQQPKQQMPLTTDDSEDWREAKRAVRAGEGRAGGLTVSIQQGVSVV